MMDEHFGDRLAGAIAAYGPLCLGLDPHPSRIPTLFGPPGAESAGAFCQAAISAAAGHVGVVKPQIAFFERWGPQGLRALSAVCAAAKAAGLLVLLDAKRGDIATTAEAYVAGVFGPEAWVDIDAITVNAYLGGDSLVPWLDAALAGGKGLAVLVRTSNAGAADLQDAELNTGEPVWAGVAKLLSPITERATGASGWSSVMAVMGASAAEEARAARALLPTAPFLVPGFGAQGGGAQTALAGAVMRDGDPQGVLVTASRSLLFAPRADREPTDERAWAEGFHARLEAARLSLAEGYSSVDGDQPGI